MIKQKDKSYNDFTAVPELSYNVVSSLFDKEEDLWRLLAYSDPDALDRRVHPDLTLDEKIALVYRGQDDITNYRVFMDMGMDDTWNVEAAMLRISPAMVVPDNYVYGKNAMSFEVYSHFKVNHLSNYTTRSMSIVQRIISCLNGSEVEGVGKLFFDRKASSLCKIVPIGRIPYKGYGVIMCNFLLGE